MATIQAPFPPSGQYISSVYTSCRIVRESSGIQISESGITNLLINLSEVDFTRLSNSHGLSFPLRFPSISHQATFLGVLSLLNFLSGYRIPLHTQTGQGAYQTVLKLLLGLYITGPEDALNASALETLSSGKVAELMGVSLHEEQPHESIPGLTVGIKGGDMNEIVELIVGACNDTGRRLRQAGYPNLGVFALKILKEHDGADYFVEKLVNLLPAFADQALITQSQPVYIYKKAFFYLQALSQRLGESVKVPQTDGLPMFVDNVIPTMLVHFGVLDLTASKSEALRRFGDEVKKETKEQQEGVRLSKEEAYTLRAAALDAGRIIVEQAQKQTDWRREMTQTKLDGYLWSLAKEDPTLRLVPRPVERGTIMY